MNHHNINQYKKAIELYQFIVKFYWFKVYLDEIYQKVASYDTADRYAKTTDALGNETISVYDALGRRTQSTDSLGRVTTFEYNALGNLVKTNFANGLFTTVEYDQLSRKVAETDLAGLRTEYEYDAAGNLTAVIDSMGQRTEYTYDQRGNKLTQTDANGNTLEKIIDGLIDTEYTYSKDNRMLSANTGTSNISYTYDAGGIRQSQTVDASGIGPVTTHYLVDPNRSYHQVLEEQDDLFIPQVIYTYGDDLISQTNSQGTHVFGYDGLGSTRILTDSAGVVQNSYGYQAFGKLDYQHGIVDNSYLFTGEQYDNNVGFYYLRARFYNPSIGRFQNMDTFPGMQFEPKSLHKYLYAHGDPVNNIDPSGNVSLGQIGATLAVAGTIYSFGSGTYNIFQGNTAQGMVEIGLGFLGVGGIGKATFAFWSKYGKEFRGLYVNLVVQRLPNYVQGLQKLGYSSKRIAELAVIERNTIKALIRKEIGKKGAIGDLINKWTELRNFAIYRNKLGPTVDYYLKRGNSYQDIVDKAARVSEKYNKISNIGTL